MYNRQSYFAKTREQLYYFPNTRVITLNDIGKMSRYLNEIKETRISMMTSWEWNAFRVTGPLWGESSGHLFHSQTFSKAGYMLALTKGWQNSRVAGDLRGHDAHCDVTAMACVLPQLYCTLQLLYRLVPWVSFVTQTASLPRKVYYIFSIRASRPGGHCYYCNHYPGALSTIHLKILTLVDEIYGWPI